MIQTVTEMSYGVEWEECKHVRLTGENVHRTPKVANFAAYDWPEDLTGQPPLESCLP